MDITKQMKEVFTIIRKLACVSTIMGIEDVLINDEGDLEFFLLFGHWEPETKMHYICKANGEVIEGRYVNY